MADKQAFPLALFRFHLAPSILRINQRRKLYREIARKSWILFIANSTINKKKDCKENIFFLQKKYPKSSASFANELPMHYVFPSTDSSNK